MALQITGRRKDNISPSKSIIIETAVFLSAIVTESTDEWRGEDGSVQESIGMWSSSDRRGRLPEGQPRKMDSLILITNQVFSRSRMVFAQSTIVCSAALVSGQLRVFSPQSGLTHNCCGSMWRDAFSSNSSISDESGTLGE